MKDYNDGRPDNVCQRCGYGVCCCNLQTVQPSLTAKPTFVLMGKKGKGKIKTL